MTDSHKYRNKKWLTEQYHEFDRSVKEIATIVDVHQSTIRNWMKKNNIPSKRKSRSPLVRVNRLNKFRRHKLRPHHDLEDLREKLKNILWERYKENHHQDFFFKVSHMRSWGAINIDRFTGSLISRILHYELCPAEIIELYKKSGRGHTFRTCFSKMEEKKNEKRP